MEPQQPPKRSKLSSGDPMDSERAGGSSENRATDPSLDSISAFEKLPRELAWKIIEHVSESVLELRSTSRLIQSHVDAYALQSQTSQLVEKIDFAMSYDNRHHDCTFQLNMHIMNYKMFELRVMLRKPENHSIKRVRGANYSYVYRLHFNYKRTDADVTIDEYNLNLIRECIGKRIGKVVVYYIELKGLLDTISKILAPYQFSSLSLINGTMSDLHIEHMLKLIERHSIEQLSLDVRNVWSDMRTPRNLLLKLATRVRSLQIKQQQYTRIDATRSYLFGIYDADFASLMIEMFSRKIDKLHIYNYLYAAYLNRIGAELLRVSLPSLGKNVWFTASCKAYANGIKEYIENDHVIQVGQATEFESDLTIKHLSRENEPCDF